MIDLVNEKDDLYRLELPKTPRSSYSLITNSLSLISKFAISNKEKKSYFIIDVQVIRHLGLLKFFFLPYLKQLMLKTFIERYVSLLNTRISLFSISNKRINSPFYLIHTDIWGPSNISNVSGSRWFVTFIDDCTHVTWVFLLKHKSDVSTIIHNFISMIKNQFGVKVQRIRSDNARDYFNQLSPLIFKRRE